MYHFWGIFRTMFLADFGSNLSQMYNVEEDFTLSISLIEAIKGVIKVIKDIAQ